LIYSTNCNDRVSGFPVEAWEINVRSRDDSFGWLSPIVSFN
jgi:hypothetical protein